MIRLILIGIFLSGWIPPTYAQEVSPPESVKIESVQFGYGGYGHYSCWIPVWVQIKSFLDASVQGEIEIQSSSFPTLKITKTVELPSRGDQPFSITPVLLSYPMSSPLKVNLKIDALALTVSYQEHLTNPMLGYEDFLIGVLAKRSADLKSKDLRYLVEQMISKKQNLQFADIAPEELSGNWSLYLTLDCLVILDLSQLSILSAQQEAILDWISSGGKLFINGGDRALSLSQSFLQPALTFELSPEQKTVLFSYKEFAKYLLKPRGAEVTDSQSKILLTLPQPKNNPPNYEILLQTESSDPLPLLLEQSFGNGKILFSTVDITQEPFAQNLLLLKFLTENPEATTKYWNTIDHSKQTLFGYLFPYFHMKSSTFWVIFSFLAAYLLGICLCHRQFSKKEKSLEFKIKLLPKNALFFSGILLLLIQFITPIQALQEIQILHYIENSPVAVQETIALFQPSKNNDVELLPQNVGYLNLGELFDFDPSNQSSVSLRRSDILLNSCEQGILRHWRWTSLYKGPELLHIQLEPESRNLKTGEVQSFKIEITNSSSQPVENLYLVGRECFVPLTNFLEAGKSLNKFGIPSRQEFTKKKSEIFFPKLFLGEQQEVLAETLWQEVFNTVSRDPKDPVFYHILGFTQLPSTFKLSSVGHPLVFDSQQVWGIVHYQFSFPPHLFVKTFSAEESLTPDEEKEK
ncbi:MAG: hypothetical protein AABZ60_04280 [Planctomycetota bacterium]